MDQVTETLAKAAEKVYSTNESPVSTSENSTSSGNDSTSDKTVNASDKTDSTSKNSTSSSNDNTSDKTVNIGDEKSVDTKELELITIPQALDFISDNIVQIMSARSISEIEKLNDKCDLFKDYISLLISQSKDITSKLPNQEIIKIISQLIGYMSKIPINTTEYEVAKMKIDILKDFMSLKETIFLEFN